MQAHGTVPGLVPIQGVKKTSIDTHDGVLPLIGWIESIIDHDLEVSLT